MNEDEHAQLMQIHDLLLDAQTETTVSGMRLKVGAVMGYIMSIGRPEVPPTEGEYLGAVRVDVDD